MQRIEEGKRQGEKEKKLAATFEFQPTSPPPSRPIRPRSARSSISHAITAKMAVGLACSLFTVVFGSCRRESQLNFKGPSQMSRYSALLIPSPSPKILAREGGRAIAPPLLAIHYVFLFLSFTELYVNIYIYI